MKKVFSFALLLSLCISAMAQNIGIGTPAPLSKLQVNHRATGSSATLTLFDSTAGTGSKLVFAKESMGNNFSIVSTIGLFAADNFLDFRTTIASGIVLRGNGRVGINNVSNPVAALQVGGGVKIGDTLNVNNNTWIGGSLKVNDTLHVTNDVNIGGKLKVNGNSGMTGQILMSNGNAADPAWESLTGTAAGNLGYGTWGDCTTAQVISGFQPASDSAGLDGDHLGYAVAISGNFAIAGAYEDDFPARRGKVIFYKHDGQRWQRFQTINAPAGNAPMFFGYSVDISDNYAIVGAYGDSSFAGAAYIYQFNGSNWTLMQKIVEDGTREAGDQFGKSVAISGNWAVLGAPNEPVSGNLTQGGAHLYRFDGASWVYAGRKTDGSGSAGDQMGTSVAIHGNNLVIGAPFTDNSSQTNDGSAYYYRYDGSSWVFSVEHSGALSNDNFGSSVAISDKYSIVGSPNASSGQGRVSIFAKSGTSWATDALLDNTVYATGDRLGSSVAISGNYAMAGAIHGEASNNGNAIIYVNIGMGWQKLIQVTDPGGYTNSNFGSGCGIDDNSKRFIIGDDSFAANYGKVVFGKIN